MCVEVQDRVPSHRHRFTTCAGFPRCGPAGVPVPDNRLFPPCRLLAFADGHDCHADHRSVAAHIPDDRLVCLMRTAARRAVAGTLRFPTLRRAQALPR
jgi:hypothetical protein